jgi:transcriptional regulator with XRE-family HTH domain
VLGSTVAEAVAGNIRAYRQLRGLEQETLARSMQSLGIAWRRATVSEAERNQRNVTIAELLGLALALETTVEQLVDTRGPEGRRGPRVSLSEGPVLVNEGSDEPFQVVGPVIPPEHVTALVCSHKAYAEVEWDDNRRYKRISIQPVEGSAT